MRLTPFRTNSTQSLRSFRAARTLLGLGVASALAWLAAGCGDKPLQTYVELSDFAGYQAESVSTGLIAPGDDSDRLVTHGWAVDPGEESPPALVMRRERGRLWFFSADGATTGVELHGRLERSSRERGRRLLCRVNGEKQSWVVIKPEAAVHRVDFAPEAVRAGWNYLQLSLRHLPDAEDESLLSLRGLRFLKGEQGFDAHPERTRIEVEGEALWMPADSVLQAVFEVPTAARFEGRLTVDAGGRSGELEVVVTVTGDDGQVTEIARVAAPAGSTAEIDQPLDAWTGSTIALRALVTGSGPVAARWSQARIAAPEVARAAPFEQLIRPSPVDIAGELGRPDVIIILLDAARADAFSPWGGPHPTPALERLAAEGTLFERALAPSSWTGQSVPAIMTGFYPETVGIRHWADGLSREVTTIAEMFGRSGYHTALWSQHPIYSRGRTLARGFESNTFVGHADRERLPEPDELFVPDKPSLAFVHLLPPHTPYEPPAPFMGQYSSWFTAEGESPVRNGFPYKKDLDALSADGRRYIRDRYQENAVFADALVGRILERLEQAGRYDNSLIAVISDHGEAFLEHDEFLHASRLYWEFLEVPFVVKWPAAATGFRPTVAESVSMVDLAPTLVSGLALTGAERGFQGRSLLPAVFRGERTERAHYAITRGDGNPTRPPKRWIRLERDGWALLWSHLDDRVELYDLENDPTEQRDLAAERPTHALLMLQELQMQYHFNRALLALGDTDADELDPGLVEELKALGYL